VTGFADGLNSVRAVLPIRLRAKRGQLERFYGPLAEIQGHNLALTVLYVPSLLDGVPVLAEALRICGGGGVTFCGSEFGVSETGYPGTRREGCGPLFHSRTTFMSSKAFVLKMAETSAKICH